MSVPPDQQGPLSGPVLRKRSDDILGQVGELVHSAQQMSYTAGTMDACELMRVLLAHVEGKGKFEKEPTETLDVFTLRYMIGVLHNAIQQNVNNIVLTEVVVVPGDAGTEGPPPGTKLS